MSIIGGITCPRCGYVNMEEEKCGFVIMILERMISWRSRCFIAFPGF